MKLTYVTDDDATPPYWYAETDEPNYDGTGPTPIDAVCAMVNQMEREMKP